MGRNNFHNDFPEHLDSERESLPFPAGGVFGIEPLRISVEETRSTDDVIASIQDVLRSMHQQMEQLADEVDEILHFPPDGPDLDPAA